MHNLVNIRVIGQKVCIKSVVCTGKRPIFRKQFKKSNFLPGQKVCKIYNISAVKTI